MFNIIVSWLLRFPEMERKAIIVMCSQKNLPTAATIISYFDPEAVGNLGLITIPCIVFYIMQLFIDAFIANTWASKYERLAAVEASYKAELKQLEAAHDSDGTPRGELGTEVLQEGEEGGRGNGVVSKAELHLAPEREARLSTGDDDASLLQTVELNDVNPLQQGKEGL